jgi:ATP-dependent helicase/nuclease subunit A
LNLVGPVDNADLVAQIQSMVDRRVFTAGEAASVDQSSVLWLLESEAGRLLRQHASVLRREMSVYFAEADEQIAAASTDPMDRRMIRGRLDVIIPLADGTIIIDYKTDSVSETEVRARSEVYRQQMAAYREAVERITGKPVTDVLLAFLSPRIIAHV